MPARLRTPFAWRAALLAGLAAGLALAAPLGIAPPAARATAVLCALVVASRPRAGRPGIACWLALLTGTAAIAGLAIGAARLAAIDGGALNARPGSPLDLRGTVTSSVRVSRGLTRFTLQSPDGTVGVESADPVSGVDEGTIVDVSGTTREPDPYESPALARAGAKVVLEASDVRPTGSARSGLQGALDDVRRRAEISLDTGTGPRAAALLRGFVLGEDDRIDEAVKDDFRRSGLAHVLAVSGQNVMLLAILATPLLALAGVPIRARLLAIGAIIAIYVPVAGASASIQRAGIMGGAGVVAALSGRPQARWYALGLAAVATLAIDPRATSDIGWQLSFAAVAGLLVLAGPLARALAPRTTGARRALAEGAAVTISATLATGPLAAHHFGTVSLTAVPANLLALPAIAPAMWLGMLSGALGQIPGAPVEPLTWLGGLCSGFIGWVAHLLGPEWAQLAIPEPSPAAAAAWTIALLGTARLTCVWLERRAEMTAAPRRPRARRLGMAALLVSLPLAALLLRGKVADPDLEPRLTLRFLDVGQGDSILVQPRGEPGLLVDTGPPDAEAGEILDDEGVDHLGAVAITHDELDHVGGLASVLESVEVDRLLVGKATPSSCSYLTCPPVTSVEAGSRFRMGCARVDVLWPPASRPLGENPNETALVLRVSCGTFDALLTSDAEAETASYSPGPVDLLKVAHHGSVDAGLDALLDRASPRLAVISVGAGNSYGHPTPETLATLTRHRVPVMRTDESGEVVVEVSRDGWTAR